MRMLIIAFLIILIPSSLAWAQGRLSEVREDVRAEEKQPDPPKQKRKRRRDCDCEGDTILGIFIGAFFEGLFAPEPREEPEIVVIEEGLVEYDVDYPEYFFPAYPYPLNLPGFMQVDPTYVESATGKEELFLKHWSTRVSIDYGNDFNDFQKVTGQILFETKSRFGLQTDWHYLYEDLGCGCADDAVIGNILLTYRFFENKKLLVRAGLGGQMFIDRYATDGGVAVLLSADFFPVQPLIFSALVEGGSLGNTGTVRSRLTGGLIWRGIEVQAGYEYFQIGSTDFHTPIAGLRVWF